MWLSDDVIHLYFELLNNNVVNGMPIYIVNPVIVQAIKCLNNVEHIVTPLNLGSKKYFFYP